MILTSSSFSSLILLDEDIKKMSNIISSKDDDLLSKDTISLNNEIENSIDQNEHSLSCTDINEELLSSKSMDNLMNNDQISSIDLNITSTHKNNEPILKCRPKIKKLNTNLYKKETSNFTKSCNILNIVNKNQSLSASTGNLLWTEWVVQKAKQSILLKEAILIKKQELKEEEKEKNEKAKVKKEMCEKKFKEWSENYDAKMLQKKIEKEKEMVQEILIKEIEKVSIRAKSKENYLEWYQKKIEDKKIKQAEEKLFHEKLLKKRIVKEEMSKLAYSKWLEISKNRPKSVCQSFAISCGRKIAYYDWGCCSQPSYKNPQKWIIE